MHTTLLTKAQVHAPPPPILWQRRPEVLVVFPLHQQHGTISVDLRVGLLKDAYMCGMTMLRRLPLQKKLPQVCVLPAMVSPASRSSIQKVGHPGQKR